FAVVAEEVKNLAEDSREAAERIAKLIKEVQSETANAVSSMQHGTKSTAEGTAIVEAAGKAFGDIAIITVSTANEVTAIATDMISAQQGIEKAAKSVDGIASIAEESASAAEESASSTEELTASMEDMAARAQSLSEMALNLQATSAKFRITEESAHVEAPARPVAKKPTPAQPKRPEVKGTGKVPAKVQESLSKRGIKTN
ncbi:MAG: methyl-accepting chemotaxis protein, partial [Methanomassiliicoccales archaeon]|nr:methyl-accepting chemotaxis protein [Methanomassiliicoccales archaeon]